MCGTGRGSALILIAILCLPVSGEDAYAIPPSNPFVQAAGFRGEIWALGLRNPWKFSFDRQTGDLYTGDVGQGSFEEVDFQPAGSEDEAGNLFIADLSGGAIHEIVAPNHPPSAPSLVSPADGTTGAPATVAFEWLPVVLFLSGILFTRKSAKFAGVLVLAGILGVFGIYGCGNGGGTSSAPPPAASNNLTHTVTGLAPNTTYYWMVEADDVIASLPLQPLDMVRLRDVQAVQAERAGGELQKIGTGQVG